MARISKSVELEFGMHVCSVDDSWLPWVVLAQQKERARNVGTLQDFSVWNVVLLSESKDVFVALHMEQVESMF